MVNHGVITNSSHHALIGAAEELGELSHAFLKFQQCIRGYDRSKFNREAEDAIGDTIIYLASFCNTFGLDLQDCVKKAWREVKERELD